MKLLKIEEAAEKLRIGRTKAYQLAQRGELPIVRLGGSIRVHEDLLEQMILKQIEIFKNKA